MSALSTTCFDIGVDERERMSRGRRRAVALRRPRPDRRSAADRPRSPFGIERFDVTAARLARAVPRLARRRAAAARWRLPVTGAPPVAVARPERPYPGLRPFSRTNGRSSSAGSG